ncbi:alpha/beta hydrolase family protein [[Pseudomonas] boreopolis]|uniref:alpha/beta hydrolase family protein n=1 Tax=Xanthomonas boreopolis TaxID=86183 RepID=UPI003DA12253
MTPIILDLQADDGHRWQLVGRLPPAPVARLLWLPALGVAARHYEPWADALANHGIAVFLHEWRGNGSSSLRPSREHDWGYRELLLEDLPASRNALSRHAGEAPLIVGGHSLGGQLACCHAALSPEGISRLWLVATGTPYWRAFPAPVRYALPLVYRFLPWLARRQGALPGRRLGFGGTEARGLIRDWACVGLTNHYAAAGLPSELETGLGALDIATTGVVMADDWLAPESSMQALLRKLHGAAPKRVHRLAQARLGTRADHFSWMRQPEAVAEQLAQSLR